MSETTDRDTDSPPSRTSERAATRLPDRKPGGCSCGRRWASLTQAHCATCHEHFGTYSLADKHHTYDDERHQTCHDPASMLTKGGKRIFRASGEAEGVVWRGFERREIADEGLTGSVWQRRPLTRGGS